MKRVAINGYGRIGRVVHRQILAECAGELEVVALNASSDAAMRRYLLQYDSLHGRSGIDVEVDGENLRIAGKPVRVVREKEPAKCPWEELGVDIVIEATGKFRSHDLAESHLKIGAKAVLITAPAKDDTLMIVRGVNDESLRDALPVVSAASCTTNCIAPIMKVIDELVGIERGLVCTTHSYTSSQNLLDNATSSSKLRIARSAALSIIPSTTGAVKACAKIFPHLQGKIDGMALRIPVPDVSAAYLALEVQRTTNIGEINGALQGASEGILSGILNVEPGLLVSSDYISDPHSCTVDMDSTAVIDGKMVQLLAWYDNEWGYGTRVMELARMIARLL